MFQNLKIKSHSKILLIPVYVLFCVIAFYHIIFAKRIIPGVEISGVNVGGMSYSQAKRVLTGKEENLSKNLTFVYEGHVFELSSSELHLDYDLDSTLVRAFEIGRTGDFVTDTKDKLAGLVKTLEIKSYYDLDENTLDSTLSYVESQVNVEPKNAYYALEEGNLKIIDSQEGSKLEGSSLYDSVILDLNDMKFDQKNISVAPINPKVTNEVLEMHFDEISKIVNTPINLTSKTKTWALSSEEILNFINVEVSDDGISSIELNKPTFEDYSELLAQEVNVLPRGQVEENDNKVVKFEIIKDGFELDIKKFTEDFKGALFSENKNVTLPMLAVNGPASPEKYGIIALVGEGTSEYTGSAASRSHNLNLAAERLHGVLIPPDGVFSFNNSVGDISGSTGYASAYIISNGRTVLGDGGGVCQTSTTLFRAVLNSGLPVIKRNPHAYRVRYYELDAPIGYDAAIYQPYLDFQFQNDTKAYLLLQAVPDEENSRLTFKLYGTPDGRKVELSEPIISGQIPPPEPLYQDDPNLPVGTVKQVDFAAWGTTSSFDRVVKRNDEILYEDNFTTRYQPWRAIYLVGTKKD